MFSLNNLAKTIVDSNWKSCERFNVRRLSTKNGGTIFDCGVDAHGGITAGLNLGAICMGCLAKIDLLPWNNQVGLQNPGSIHVMTDQPAWACMGSQYAGWPIKVDKYFAMGSGPMRLNRGREEVLTKYFEVAKEKYVVGVLETDSIPSDAVIELIAEQCHVEPDKVTLFVAPTNSQAGMIQIVARSIEATMHKLYELEFDILKVVSAWGFAPLPPFGGDTITAIGRSNDAILYGGEVQLWIDDDDEAIDAIAPKVPSDSSKDFGKPFKEIFESFDNDFYAIDKMLFSSAKVTLTSTRSGHSVTVGKLMPELLQRSFEN